MKLTPMEDLYFVYMLLCKDIMTGAVSFKTGKTNNVRDSVRFKTDTEVLKFKIITTTEGKEIADNAEIFCDQLPFQKKMEIMGI